MRFRIVHLCVIALSLCAIDISAMAQDKVDLRLCTGGETGNYYKSGQFIANQAKGSDVTVQVVKTAGSWDNLSKLTSGQCDAAIIQSDAWVVWNAKNPSALAKLVRADSLYDEYVHLFCNRKAKLNRVTDLYKNPEKYRVLIGPNGSGTQVTWDGFVLADKDYGKVPTSPEGGNIAKLKVKDGENATCGLYVGGLKSAYMNGINELGKDIVLVPVDDADFDNARDPHKKRIYEFKDIPGGTYRNIQDGAFSSSVKTVTVKAILVLNSDWTEKNTGAYEKFLEFQLKAQNDINQMIYGKR